MTRIEKNNRNQDHISLPGMNFPPMQAKIADDRDTRLVSSSGLFVDLDQAVVEMLMKIESAEFIEENY